MKCSILWLAGGAVAHKKLSFPPTRESSLVNGLVMGLSNTGDQIDNNEREFVATPSRMYENFACGGTGLPQLRQNVELAGNRADKPFQFDFSLPPDPAQAPVTSFRADEEMELVMEGYHHPGVVRVALCFADQGEDCNALASYEKHILGYAWTQGVADLSSDDIYAGQLRMTVKMPSMNSDRAVLQMLHDSHDIRSYVQCADITLEGAVEQSDITPCNGHPFCDCDKDQNSNAPYGLHGRCPMYLEGAYNEWPQINTIGRKEFCNLCIEDGCPTACGGALNGTYNGANTIGGVHRTDLPRYFDCTPETCNCPGCLWT